MYRIRAYNMDDSQKPILNIYDPFHASELIFDTELNQYVQSAILEGTVDIELGKAGSAEITIPPTNPGYSRIKKMKTIVQILDGSNEVFCGRVLHEDQDFNNNKKLYLEGELARLIDAVMPFPKGDADDNPRGEPYKYEGTAHGYLGKCLTIYNSQEDGVNPLVLFQLDPGRLTSPYISSDYATTSISFEEHEYVTVQDAIYNKIIDVCGGYLKVRHVGYDSNGFPLHTIDYVTETDIVDDSETSDLRKRGAFRVSTQKIEFSKNLLDLTDSITAEDTFTVLLPLGKMGEQEIEYIEDGKTHKKTVNTKRLDISGVNRDSHRDIDPVDNGHLYICDPVAQGLYGNIWKTVVWDDVTDANQLYGLAHTYLGQHNNVATSLVLNAADLHMLDPSVESFRLGDFVEIHSWPHRLPHRNQNGNPILVQCKKISLDLLNPGSSEYTFETLKKSISEMQSSTASNVDSVKAVINSNAGSSIGITTDASIFDPGQGITTMAAVFASVSTRRVAWFYISSSIITDTPSSDNGMLEVRKLDNDWGSMTYYSNDEKTYIAYMTNGALGSWKEVK